MGCNCNNSEKEYTTLSTSENNINVSDNFLLGAGTNIINNDPEDHGYRYQPEQPLLKFLANKKPCDNLEAAKEMIYRRRPPLVLGQPAVVQYYDASGYIKLLFCIGAALDSSAIMFQITDEGGSGDCSALVARIVALEQQMVNVDASIVELKAKDVQQDISINLAINNVNDISAKVSTYDASINTALSYASEAKAVADDVSGRVGTFDSRISQAQYDASTAKQIAEDVSSNVGTFDARITEAQTDASVAKKIAEDVSVSVSKYDTSINIAVTYATEAKSTADDVSAKVVNYDNSINIAINTSADASTTAAEAKQTAIDASNKTSDDNIQEIVQRLLDLGYITVTDASTANYAEDSSTANYATNASYSTYSTTSNYATEASTARSATYATYAEHVGSAEDASKAEGIIWYDVEE